MVPLYAARARDLKRGDMITITCACGHEALIDPVMLPSLGLKPETHIRDLERRLYCMECQQRGKAVVSIKWRPQ